MTSTPDSPSTPDLQDSTWFHGQEARNAEQYAARPAPQGPSTFPADGVDPLFDPEWHPPRRFNRLSAILAAGVVAAGAFAGGAALQRSHDAGLTTAAAATRTGRTGGFGGAGGFPSGFPSGGFGGGQAAGGAGTGPGAATTGTATDTPVLVGTVVGIQPGTVTVKNFAGATVVVHLSATATVTVTGATSLQPGAAVAVHGTRAADGSVTATALISRKAAG